MAPGGPGGPAVYLTGSDELDRVTASYASGAVTFTLGAGSVGQFEAGTAGGCSAPSGGTVSCPVAEAPDSILLAGLDGNDVLSAPGLPETAAVVLAGERGRRRPHRRRDRRRPRRRRRRRHRRAAAAATTRCRTTAAPTSSTPAPGEDLFISNAVCDGDLLDGGGDRDNANWANFGTGDGDRHGASRSPG